MVVGQVSLGHDISRIISCQQAWSTDIYIYNGSLTLKKTRTYMTYDVLLADAGSCNYTQANFPLLAYPSSKMKMEK